MYMFREGVGHNPDFREGEVHSPDVIILASSSPRRRDLVTAMAGDIPVECIPLGHECPDPDPAEVAFGKLCDCKDILASRGPEAMISHPLMIAADTRAMVLYRPSDDHSESPLAPRWLNLGKLPDHPTIQRVFSGMLEAAKATGSLPQYRIVSGSVSEFGPHRLTAKHESLVELRPEYIEGLSTERGLQDYIRMMQQVDAACNASFHRDYRVTPLDRCAGIHLETFVVSGAVARIDGIPSEDPRFIESVKRALGISAHGISHRVMEPQFPDARRFMSERPGFVSFVNLILAHSRRAPRV